MMMLLAMGLGALLAAVYVRMEVPNLAHLQAGIHPNLGLATIVYTADEQELTRYYRQNRTWVSYAHLSPRIIEALIATEDHRFYAHSGVDWFRLASSTWKTLWGDRQGGSTLTMQLVRNYFPDIARAPALERKLYEVTTALKIERVYRKNEILEMYLNTVPFGYQTYGIETAAQTYFNKSASALNVVESATLVGMLKAITRYNPVRNPARSIQRRNVVLRQMLKNGTFALADFERWLREPLALDFQFKTTATGPAPHFAEYTRSWLEDWAAQKGYDLYADGLKVYTTLDTRLQGLAEAAVAEQMRGLQAVAAYEWSRRRPALLAGTPAAYKRALDAGRFEPFAYFRRSQQAIIDQHARQTERYRQALRQGATDADALHALRNNDAFIDSLCTDLTRLETGLVALDPASGRVLAWVGGSDFAQDQYDKVALARRQPGSTFKPFVYAAALERGYSPLDERIDSVRTYQTLGPDKTWTPTNAGGTATGDTLTLRDGLALSKNTITAQLMHEIGPNWVAHTARRMGIRSPLAEVPSLALGTSEVSLLELVSAYGPLANQGQYHEPIFVTRIEDRNGRPLATFASKTREAISPYTAYDIVEMMRAVVEEGTGGRIRSVFGINADVAGKTGTTQNSADGWFVLLHPNLAVGSWVGFNDRQVTFRSNFWGQGGHNALYVVGDFFRRVLKTDPAQAKARFAIPAGYTPPDSLRADTPSVYAAAPDSTASPADNHPDDIEGFLRTVASNTVASDSLNADTRSIAHADTAALPPPITPFRADSARAIPIDAPRERTASPPKSRADTDVEQAMRRMLFPDTPTGSDSTRARPPRERRDQD